MKFFPKKSEKVQKVTNSGAKSNRRNFKFAAYVLGLMWLLTFMFALSAIWVPVATVSASFSGSAWLFGWISFLGTGLWLFLANEFMDVN